MKKLARYFLLLLPLLLLHPAPAPTEEPYALYILMNGQQPAYQQVIQGLSETAPGISLTIFDLSNPDTPGKIRSSPPPAALLTLGSQALKFAQEIFPQIPTIYAMILNPDLYLSPEANATGIPLKIRPRTQLETFKRFFPSLKRVGVIFDPGENQATVTEAQSAARELGLILVEKRVTNQREIGNAIKDIIWTIDALWMIPDSTVVSKESFQYLLENSLDRRFPLFAFSENFVKAGALLALAPRYQDIGRQAGTLLKQVLSGKSPKSLPPLYPESRLILNLKTASALNLSLPPELLNRAEKTF
jgi:putative ABC transport system substrate-binding protein